MIDNYEKYAAMQIQIWRKKMISRPSFFNKLSKRLQTIINSWIPEKVHLAITTTIKQMIRGVLFGSKYTTSKPMLDKSLEVREAAINERIKAYKDMAAIEGGITGAGGLLLGLADFPILIGIKIKCCLISLQCMV